MENRWHGSRTTDWRTIDSSPRFFFEGGLELGPGRNHVYLRSVGSRGERVFSAMRLDVGEIFIVAGQSNAAGSARTLFIPESDAVRRAELTRDHHIVAWRHGSDPQIPNGGGSVWPLVGDRLAAELGLPIGFVNCAVGATSIREWQPGTPAFEGLVTAVSQLGPDGFRAILWHQGESDIEMSAEEYRSALESLIRGIQERLGKPVPWLIAQATFQSGRVGEGVRKAQREVVAKGIAFAGPDTDTLGLHYRESRDELHLNARGTRAAADLWSTSIREAFFAAPDGAPAPSHALGN